MVYTSFSAISALVFLALGALSSINAAAIPATSRSSLDISQITRPKVSKVFNACSVLSGSNIACGEESPSSTNSKSKSNDVIHRRFFNPLKLVEDAGKGVKDVEKLGKLFDHSTGNSTRRSIFVKDTDDTPSDESDQDIHRRLNPLKVVEGAGKGIKDIGKGFLDVLSAI